jgi:hypothetical protein
LSTLAIVATLRDGAEEDARRLLEHGPPFDPAVRGFDRHVVFLSANEVVFVFEGPEAEWRLDEIVDEPGLVREALGRWRTVVDGAPRIARPVYAWAADETAPAG